MDDIVSIHQSNPARISATSTVFAFLPSPHIQTHSFCFLRSFPFQSNYAALAPFYCNQKMSSFCFRTLTSQSTLGPHRNVSNRQLMAGYWTWLLMRFNQFKRARFLNFQRKVSRRRNVSMEGNEQSPSSENNEDWRWMQIGGNREAIFKWSCFNKKETFFYCVNSRDFHSWTRKSHSGFSIW